ncbi:ubiquitin C-terminal hydrolase [Ephemerocybe angulata]|uniref:ubiquitinyl hydrolase 1 n=1 Tax=Ephemerocybe angulata TaxID=980116 RepID=A0A8H6HW94_9AGAR|nr:ubiquitin C-terminal hydrolase [Tulosesus angulatus]
MARSKWISFTAQQALSRDSQKSAKPEDAPPAPLSTEIKKFGLENALFFCDPFRDLLLQHSDPSVPQDLFSPKALLSSTPTGPSKPQPTLAPVRRKPERKHSSSTYPSEASASTTTQPQAIPIPPSPPTLFSALRSLFYHIASQPGEKGSVAPKAFIEKLKELNDVFRSTMHQDAHEFLNYLLNQIVEEMDEERKQAQNASHGEELTASVATLASKVPTVVTAASSNSGTPSQDATLVHKLFEGILTSETRCLTCETVSARDESFLDLSIDIEQNSSVTACLRHFSASEMLCQKNKFFCDSCCDLQEAEKRMKIKKLPNVLALHLKRFKYQEDLGRYIKLTYRVAFPMELRLFNTVDDMENADRLYGLFAIVVHIGTGPHQGHYISIIKTGGSWFVFDDDAVYPIAEGDINKYFGDSNSGSAYVLYYQAVDLDLEELGLHQTPDPIAVSDSLPMPVSGDQSLPAPVALEAVGPPPGLESEEPIVEDPVIDPISSLTPPRIIPPEKRPLEPSGLGLTGASDLLEQQASFISIGLPSPSPSTPGLRAPSSSLSRPSTSAASGTERKRSGAERSPRPSASSPSLSESAVATFSEPPPPVPPLPPIIQTPESPTTPMTPMVNLPSEEKEKARKESTKSGGWFSKRKSLKLAEKSKPTPTEPVGPSPPSPNRRVEEPSSSGWFKGFGTSTREYQTTSLTSENSQSKELSFDLDKRRSKNGGGQHLTVNGNGYGNGIGADETPPTPGSATSSLNSNSPAHPSRVRPSTGASSSSSSSSGDRPRTNGVDRRKSKDSRSSSPASSRHRWPRSFPSGKIPDLERSLPPLPPAPTFLSHIHHPSNGHSYVAEPKAYTNGALEPDELESSTASASFTDDMRSHSRSTTLPPPTSLAASAGANLSSGSAPPTTFGLRKATRKLSLTGPILGFGRRDKKPS